MSDRYEVITWRGHKFDRWTVAALEEVERRLGFELDYTQGSLSTSVGASASTHAGLGVGDCGATETPTRVVRVMRAVGFAAWFRPELWRDGRRIWGPHIHFVLVGNERASTSALRQVISYRAGRDGLAGNSLDRTWRPNPIPIFDYTEDDMTKDEMREVLAEFFRDTDGGAPDIGNARIKRPDGTVTTLARVAQEVHDLAQKG